MRLILVGCEYVGTTTLAHAIDDWMDAKMGVRFSLIHDHWKIPHTSGHPDDSTPEEQAWLLDSTPKFKEMHQRHSLYYHVQAGTFDNPDGMHARAHRAGWHLRHLQPRRNRPVCPTLRIF